MKLDKSIEILNTYFGYVDVENDEDYSDDEIIEIADNKLADLFYDEDYNMIEKITGQKAESQEQAEQIIEKYKREN